jgi:hypothetical protein
MHKTAVRLLAALVVALATAAPAWANHGPMTDHLPPSQANVDLVAKLKLSNVVSEWVTDVATYRDTAYLGAWHTRCGETPSVPGGFWSVDISNPSQPKELTFVSSPPGAYLTEGLHAFRMTTPSFTGDVLVVSQETCTDAGQGGISLYDVTNPAAPVPLKLSFGESGAGWVHDSHSAFAWDAGDKAYAVFVDNIENNFDIADITDPRNPVMISQIGIGDLPQAQDNQAFGGTISAHDVIVRRVEGHWMMLISYWDPGYIVMNVDNPANPVYVKDSDYPATDPLTGFSPPEGNAHEAEWDRCPEEGVRSKFPCGDVRYILAADEDFSAYRLTSLRMLTGPNAGQYDGGEFGFTPPIATSYRSGVMEGPTVWGGTGCPADRPLVPQASSVSAPVGPNERKIIVFTRGGCFFSEKIESGQLAGYDAVAIGNSHGGTGNGVSDGPFCGGQGHEYVKTASAICIGHGMMHRLFNDPPAFTGPEGADFPPLGTVGEKIRAEPEFDGFGYLNLIDADTMQHLDAYAVPQALDPRFATGFGDLSVHEITTDPTGDVGYLAWYSAGFRVVDYSGGDLDEVGHFIDERGNDIWGVELNVRKDGKLFSLASDRDYGLYIFRFGTDLRPFPRIASRTTVGRAVTLNSVVRNDGTIAETGTRYNVNLPRGMRALSASSSQGRCTITRSVVRCNLGVLRDGASARVLVRVVPLRAGTHRITTTVNGKKTEYDVGNNERKVTLRATAGGTLGGDVGLTGRP